MASDELSTAPKAPPCMTQRPALLSQEAGESCPRCPHHHVPRAHMHRHIRHAPAELVTHYFWVTTPQFCQSGHLWEPEGTQRGGRMHKRGAWP